ncbi:ABC transporter ATP-binding protein [Enterocloster bolteae]|uniref:ABC transporter ATP-binding protein n=1 Tax=Enterocloster bolteae TaxID=208479 RepID=UPI001FAD6A94|nr:ABC transporter ATP-binding protein [Enterocloster bolteae]
MDHEKPIIYVKNVRKVYRMGDEEVVALKRINLRIYKGEVCCIFGTSGSGKSTLLNQLAGMEKPTKGQVFIRGKNISDMNEEELAAFRQEHMSFIFQSYNLLPSMTAVENVAMPLMFKGMDRKKREAMAEEMLKRVGLSHRLHHYPSQMSGGQQQRAGIARAFVSRPEVVFADEPTGSVKLVQHYPKEIPVILFSLSMRISEITDRHSVRFSSRVSDL